MEVAAVTWRVRSSTAITASKTMAMIRTAIETRARGPVAKAAEIQKTATPRANAKVCRRIGVSRNWVRRGL